MCRRSHAGAACLLALFAAPTTALRMDPSWQGRQPVGRAAVIHAALTSSEPPQGGLEAFPLQKILRRHGNGSAATQGKLFKMEKRRSYEGPWPDWSAAAKASSAAPSAPAECRGVKKWAVVTSIFLPTEAVTALGRFPPSWCTVVVGDLKGPQRGKYLPKYPRLVHLSSEEQRGLSKQWRTVDQLPWNSFGRKNLGYLYAAAQGAELIFDFDDDNVPLASLDTLAEALLKGEEVKGRLVSGGPYANVYPLFTEVGGNIWPRGFPLQGIQEEAREPVSATAETLAGDRLGVVQSLAQANPDVDAVYRLTGKLPVTFSASAPLTALRSGTFSPFNAQATLWRRPAFLAMLLPVTVHGRVADIWRSLVAQPLLWQRNLSLAFAPPKVEVRHRNEHELMADLEAEWPLYYKVHGLLMHLAASRLPSKSPEEALFATYVDLYEHGILEEKDVALVGAWVQDMRALAAGSQAEEEEEEEETEEERAEEDKAAEEAAPQAGHVRPLEPKSRVALHMHFNWPQFWDGAIFFLEKTEICHPRNFLLCTFVSDWSNNHEAKTQLPSKLPPGNRSRHGVPIRLVDCPENFGPGKEHGGFMYKCFARSMQLIFAPSKEWPMPDGLFVMADDAVLLRPWRNVRAEMQRDGGMVLPFGQYGDCDAMTDRPCEIHIHGSRGMLDIRNALQSLTPLLKKRVGVNDSSALITKTLGDVVYIPRILEREFRGLADHFYERRVWLEWAVDPIRRALGGTPKGLEEPAVSGLALWLARRNNIWRTIKAEVARGKYTFVHPLKLSSADNRKRLEKFYRTIF